MIFRGLCFGQSLCDSLPTLWPDKQMGLCKRIIEPTGAETLSLFHSRIMISWQELWQFAQQLCGEGKTLRPADTADLGYQIALGWHILLSQFPDLEPTLVFKCRVFAAA